MGKLPDRLAGWQGGLHLKPGKTYEKELTKAEVLELFGGIPVYLVMDDIHVRVQEIQPDIFKIYVRKVIS